MAESRHARAFRKLKLREHEELLASTDGYVGKMMGKGAETQHNGALVVTNMRAAFYRKGLFGEVLKTVSLEDIVAVDQSSLLGHKTVTIRSSGGVIEFRTFSGGELGKCLEELDAAMTKAKTLQEHPTIAGAADELRKLAALVEEGILSQEDWERAKAAYIGKPSDKQSEAIRLLRGLHDLTKHGALTESEFRQKKWDILSKPS